MALAVKDGNQTSTTLSSIVTGGEHIVAHSVVSLGTQAKTDITNAISGSVVSISNFPSTQTIAGTVTANGLALGQEIGNVFPLGIGQVGGGGVRAVADFEGYYVPVAVREGTVTVSNSVTIGSLPAISGTVTANVFGNKEHSSSVYFGNVVPVQIIRTDDDIAGTNGAPLIVAFDSNSGSTTVTISNSVTIGSLPAISGTVTVGNSVTIWANPSGALTTHFGSVTTANLSQLTSCVTNTSRKYLLAQNISAGTVTIGIGFSPTTTQGIQLTAGAGLTFDAFCPTGAVYWLGAVTGGTWTILEG